MSENLLNMVAAMYYLALFVSISYIFMNIASIDIASLLLKALEPIVTLLQQIGSLFFG
jgi:hypothetical protein